MARLPALPQLLNRKIYKTGQTRGADDDVIYQNRVSRNSTVLIPYELWDQVAFVPEGEEGFERGYIALIKPTDYFQNPNIQQELISRNLVLGQNALIFYQLRSDWDNYNPERLGWVAANSRESPLGGSYVARVAGTTAQGGNGDKISRGFNTTGMKGAGIRLFEYAPQSKIEACRIQLEAVFWMCQDSIEAATEFGMSLENANARKLGILHTAGVTGLLDMDRLYRARMIDRHGVTVCPLCLERLSGYGFFNRMSQAMGRQVHDLTITEVNLFHIDELRYGVYNHKPYNLGWGHHHCNVVVKDSGIEDTLTWMENVLKNNSLLASG
ncbi:BstXI family restriction endonuclease [Pseudoalteromonas sp. McH1-42]|uniref:BstXI family restriction endonuclease n=1 Tax=Pseudoalteromonas sp. McH1-42 TaxID=2917752 RepID=UPI001EF47C36|nr:BstXI family restriction endonuclease [Pseudoalteromonas sp. McH1-42]MCG7561921.1 BstXI family restriction endonuclease [Pseudoalteromonas sp. McH1-42]